MTSFPELFIPEKFEQGALQGARAVQGFDKVLIATHVNPDGDAVGASSACGYILKSLGREFAFVAPGGIPKYLDFLELPGPLYEDMEKLPFKPESAVFVDCSDKKRLGPKISEYVGLLPSLNVDHHLCEKGLGSIYNFIDTQAAAACQLMAYLGMKLGLRLEDRLAESLAVGLLTDTGQFAHGNTNADIFLLCAQLERNGCHFSEIGEKLHHVWTLHRLRIWGRSFLDIHQACHGKIAWCLITLEDIEREEIGKDDMEGFSDTLRRIIGVEIAVFGREHQSGEVRFSLRSRNDVNVQEITASLGGGGHRNAAGVTLKTDAQTAMNTVLAACSDYLERRT